MQHRRALAAIAALLVTGCGAGAAKHTETPKLAGGDSGSSGGESHETITAQPADDTAKMTVHFLDVGQGAATIVEFSCAAALIDTGGESNQDFDSTKNLKEAIDRFFQARPDLNKTFALMVLTHNHIDHTRAAKVVWGEYKVQNVVTNGLTGSSGGKQQASLIQSAQAAGIGLEAIEARKVPRGGLTDSVIDPIKCDDGDPDIRVLWGAVDENDVNWSPKAIKNANNSSVVVRFALGKSSLIVTGDLEEEGIDELLKRHEGTNALDSDIYEVGHHGSHNATTEALLSAITPKMAVIEVGSPDRHSMWTAYQYGHPRMLTIEKLETALRAEKPRLKVAVPIAIGAKRFESHEVTAPIYASAWDGEIVVTAHANGSMSASTRGSP